MQKYTLLLLLTVLLLISCSKSDDTSTPLPNVGGNPTEEPFFIKGADASSIPQIRQSGITMLNANGQPEDMLTTLKNAGVNTIRIRLWHNPADNHSSFEEVKAFAAEVKNNNMRVWLTVHYSDTWADPGHQDKPAQWQSVNYAQLLQEVYNYTEKIVTEIQPEYIQIGNEINGGFLWEEGRSTNPQQFTALLNQGITAVRDNSSTCKIILHYAGHEGAASFYNNVQNLDYDIIGLSYYPIWHEKNLTALQNNMAALANQYNKDVVIAETSYPFTLEWNDYTNNIIGSTNQLLTQYPPTPTGQQQYLNQIKQMTKQAPNGIGFCYWGAELVAFNGPTSEDGSATENLAFWDFNNKALPILTVYND